MAGCGTTAHWTIVTRPDRVTVRLSTPAWWWSESVCLSIIIGRSRWPWSSSGSVLDLLQGEVYVRNVVIPAVNKHQSEYQWLPNWFNFWYWSRDCVEARAWPDFSSNSRTIAFFLTPGNAPASDSWLAPSLSVGHHYCLPLRVAAP